MTSLHPTAAAIVGYVLAARKLHGPAHEPPSAEIARALGLCGPAAVTYHRRRLAVNGVLPYTPVPGGQRGKVTDGDVAEIFRQLQAEGVRPTCLAIAERAGCGQETARNAWGRLASAGVLPPPPPRGGRHSPEPSPLERLVMDAHARQAAAGLRPTPASLAPEVGRVESQVRRVWRRLARDGRLPALGAAPAAEPAPVAPPRPRLANTPAPRPKRVWARPTDRYLAEWRAARRRAARGGAA